VRLLAFVVLAAVELGGGFGSASAGTTDLSDTSMTVELTVEVKVSAQAVVAHLVVKDDDPVTLPLLDRGDGTFGIRTELARKDYVVVFEALGDPGAVSQGVTLTGLGASLTEVTGPEGREPGSDDGDGLSDQTQRFGWLALALGAASLSALAFWVLGGREGRRNGSAPGTEEE
jgi:hypothetical protein